MCVAYTPRRPVAYLPQTQLTEKLRLLTPLGRGGMGELWLAEHLTLRTQVVIKFIAEDISGRPGSAKRFAEEAAAAARVNSAHVVKVLDYGASSGGAPFIVMEKLEGRDLGAELDARGRLPPEFVARITEQLARALEAAHAAGVVHRDVKPSNVFLCRTSSGVFVKLLDFGVAKTSDANRTAFTASGACVGTPGYMSPEQLVGARAVDHRADVWSLGALVFHCLTGRKPFAGETAAAIALAIHTLPLPSPSEHDPALPPAVDPWFARACARDVGERFGTALELSRALSAALGVPVEAPTQVTETLNPTTFEPPAATATATSGRVAPSPAARPVRARRPLAIGAAILVAAAAIYARAGFANRAGAANATASSEATATTEPANVEVPAMVPALLPAIVSAVPEPGFEAPHADAGTAARIARSRAHSAATPVAPPPPPSNDNATASASSGEPALFTTPSLRRPTAPSAPALATPAPGTPGPRTPAPAAPDASRLYVTPDVRR
jgi:hypothetical protein